MNYHQLEKMVSALSREDASKLLQVLLDQYGHNASGHSSDGVGEADSSYRIDKEVEVMEVQLGLLLEKLIHLPPKQQAEVGHFIDFLHQRHAAGATTDGSSSAGERASLPGKEYDNDLTHSKQGQLQITDLLGQLDWDASFDYKQERSRKP